MIKKWMTVLAAAAIAVCCAGCSQTAQGNADVPPETETVQQEQTTEPKNTLTAVVQPQDNEALDFCLTAALSGQMRLHNNRELMAFIAAKDSGQTASYTTEGYLSGLPATCEVVYDGTQYVMTIHLEFYGLSQDIVAHYLSLAQLPNSDGLTVSVYLTDCIDEEQMMPSVKIGVYWAQEVVDEIDSRYNATYTTIPLREG